MVSDLPSWAKGAVAIIAALTTAAVTLIATGAFDCDCDDKPVATAPPIDVPEAIAVDTTGNAKPDEIVPLGPEAREVTESFVENDGHDVDADVGMPLRGDDGPREPVAKPLPPFAADSIDGCATRFLTTNWSYRRAGVQVKWFALHFTAGPDRPGSRADVDGLTAYGNRPSARVSWHFNVDKDGNCDYNVPLRYKAWTFGNANDPSVNTEVAGAGEAPYLREAGYRKLAQIFVQVRRSYPAIQLRVGSVSNCSAGAGGIVTHWQGGACSGGHTDIRPHELNAVVAKLRQHIDALECDAKCERVKRQRAVVEGRDRKHKETHTLMRTRGCRGRIHSQPPSAFTRDECRALKRKDVRQRKGEARARAKLKALRG